MPKPVPIETAMAFAAEYSPMSTEHDILCLIALRQEVLRLRSLVGHLEAQLDDSMIENIP